MKLKNSLEEAICILLVLSMAEEGHPIKSAIISQQLGVSDSYLKKILRKLVLGNIIVSSISKGGGFCLARPLGKIFMLDVFYAIEGRESYIRTKHLTGQVFPSSTDAQLVENNLVQFFREGEEVLYQRLANYSIEDLLKVKEV